MILEHIESNGKLLLTAEYFVLDGGIGVGGAYSLWAGVDGVRRAYQRRGFEVDELHMHGRGLV
jgi:hypothetical protein